MAAVRVATLASNGLRDTVCPFLFGTVLKINFRELLEMPGARLQLQWRRGAGLGSPLVAESSTDLTYAARRSCGADIDHGFARKPGCSWISSPELRIKHRELTAKCVLSESRDPPPLLSSRLV